MNLDHAADTFVALALFCVAAVLFGHRCRAGSRSRGLSLVIVGVLAIGASSIHAPAEAIPGPSLAAALDAVNIDLLRGVAKVVGLGLVITGFSGWLPSLIAANEDMRRTEIVGRISKAIARETGLEFHRELVSGIADALGAHTAFVGVLTPDGDRIETLSVYSRGRFIDNFTYPLKGSPCIGVLRGEVSLYTHGVAKLFPEDAPLSQKCIEGYVGNGLIGTDGTPIGIVVALLQTRIADPVLAENLMRVFADRAAAEIERQRMEHDLEVSRDQLLEAQVIGQIGHWRSIESTERMVWSDMMFEITGLPRRPAVELESLLELLSAEDRRRMHRTLLVAIRDHESFAVDLRFTRPDGEIRWMSVVGRPSARSTPDLQNFQGIVQDITERKRFEHKLLEAHAAKTTFLAIMSHELRTPLNPIIGFSSILARDAEDALPAARRREYARDILLAGEHMMRLVADVLDLSAVELNAASLESEETDLSELIATVAGQLKLQAKEAGLRLMLDLPGTGATAFVDERRMRQVLFNLLSNAIKFTPPGGWVRVTLGESPAGGAEVSVSDTGIGIRSAEIETLLQPFRQAEGALVRNSSGLGLGLAICKSLVEAHSGELMIESEVGVGTTVRVVLPPPRGVALAVS